MRHLYRVHVEGVWERPEDGAEWGMHRVVRSAATDEGFWADFKMRQRAHLVGGVRHRHGTFEANGVMVVANTPSKAVTRAQQYLRQFIGDLTCTPPKLVFDRDAARTHFAGRDRRLDRAAA